MRTEGAAPVYTSQKPAASAAPTCSAGAGAMRSVYCMIFTPPVSLGGAQLTCVAARVHHDALESRAGGGGEQLCCWF
jgi:hypothetical protein